MDPHTIKIMGILLGMFGSLFLAYQLLGKVLRPLVVAVTAAFLGVVLDVTIFTFVDQKAYFQAVATHPLHTGIGWYDAYAVWSTSHLGTAATTLTSYAILTFVIGFVMGYYQFYKERARRQEKQQSALSDESSPVRQPQVATLQADSEVLPLDLKPSSQASGRFPSWVTVIARWVMIGLRVLGAVVGWVLTIAAVVGFLALMVFLMIKVWQSESYIFTHFLLESIIATVGFFAIIAILYPISRRSARLDDTQLGGVGVLLIVASYIIQLVQS